MNDDINEMAREDLQKFKNMRSGDGMDTSLPGLIELAFTTLTALVGIVWLLSLLWVPDAIDGITWMSLGALGGVMFGLPAALIYALRRGGVEVIRAMVRGVAGS